MQVHVPRQGVQHAAAGIENSVIYKIVQSIEIVPLLDKYAATVTKKSARKNWTDKRDQENDVPSSNWHMWSK